MAAQTRRSFYVTTELFERDVSRSAKLVLTYLSRVANRDGVCFPSVGKIAQHCGCCENTVRKAITELCDAGMLKREPLFVETCNGKQRQRANRYTILSFSSAKTEPTPLQNLNPPPAKTEGEINNNSKLTTAKHTPSVRKDPTDATELALILDRLYLHLYEDRPFAESVEHAIRTMYYADWITVKGTRIPQGSVRSVLNMLRIGHIDYIQAQLRNFTDPVINGERYLMSCIYNAPIDCAVNAMRDW